MGLFLSLGLLWASVAQAQHPASGIAAGRPDPTKIVTAESCGECHLYEYEVWQKTLHSTGFKTLHRKESAANIAQKLGLRLIKRESRCLNCHYTPSDEGDKLRAISGVSCESCHGAGQDWIDVHNDYGGKGIDHTTETPEHRAQRIAASQAAGMRRSSDLYPVVSNCFGCHTVPDEELVNVGGHSTGSGNFELVARSELIRHNFLESFLTGDGSENAVRDQPFKRRLYIVGRLVDLEYSVRGIAAAKEQGVYLKAMLRRSRIALSEVRAIAEAESLPQVSQSLETIKKTPLTLGQRDAQLAAADRIGELTQSFLQAYDGTQLAAIDPLLSGERPEIVLADGGDDTTGPAAPASGIDRGPGIQTVGQHRTVGPGACSSCHGPQNSWWFDDPHSTSAERFFDQEPRMVEFARLYGLDPDAATRGDSACMTCHGTVVTGRERRQVQDGVGCESCHGAAADYLEPHREGDKALGESRPGYVQALQLGMVKLIDHDVRARVCTTCHYITDEKLLATGHPSGEGFDYPGGMTQVRHWEDPPASAERLLTSFQTAVAARGPIPQVEILSRPPVDVRTATTTPGQTTVPAVATSTDGSAPSSADPAKRITGRIKTRVHEPSGHNTLGPSACSACHASQNEWWPGDAHYRSADPFFEDSPEHQKIARLYGLQTGQMTRGNQICMDCHGTIVTGKETRQVQDGVSCESCHGDAADFIEPHQEGDKALGVQRPGYVKALGLGMRELRDAETRAKTCTDCHHIRESRLIAAGHPTGVGFDYLGGMSRINHWDASRDDAATLARAFQTVLEARGAGGAPRLASTTDGEPVQAPTPFLPRPAETADGDEDTAPTGASDVPQFDSTPSIEQLLLDLKSHLTELYRKVRAKGDTP